MAKYVKAVHALTGFIQEVPENYLEIFDAFSLADEDKIAEARKQAEIEMFGKPKSVKPDMTWRKEDIQEYALEHDIDYEASATKADLIDLIDAQEGAN